MKNVFAYFTSPVIAVRRTLSITNVTFAVVSHLTQKLVSQLVTARLLHGVLFVVESVVQSRFVVGFVVDVGLAKYYLGA